MQVALEQADPERREMLYPARVGNDRRIVAAAQGRAIGELIGHPLRAGPEIGAEQAETDAVGMEISAAVAALDLELDADGRRVGDGSKQSDQVTKLCR
jgi:hypothetical protein